MGILEEGERFYQNEKKAGKKGKSCALCGTTKNLELHRITPPKIENRKPDTKGDYNRKTVTLCVNCHQSTEEHTRKKQ